MFYLQALAPAKLPMVSFVHPFTGTWAILTEDCKVLETNVLSTLSSSRLLPTVVGMKNIV